MEESNSTSKNLRKLLPILIFLIIITVIFFILVGKLATGSTQTKTRAAGSEVIETTGIIYKMPKCLDNFICFYLVGNDNNSYLLSNKKYSDSFSSKKTISYDIQDLEAYQNKTVSIKGFLVSGENRYVIITE